MKKLLKILLLTSFSTSLATNAFGMEPNKKPKIEKIDELEKLPNECLMEILEYAFYSEVKDNKSLINMKRENTKLINMKVVDTKGGNTKLINTNKIRCNLMLVCKEWSEIISNGASNLKYTKNLGIIEFDVLQLLLNIHRRASLKSKPNLETVGKAYLIISQYYEGAEEKTIPTRIDNELKKLANGAPIDKAFLEAASEIKEALRENNTEKLRILIKKHQFYLLSSPEFFKSILLTELPHNNNTIFKEVLLKTFLKWILNKTNTYVTKNFKEILTEIKKENPKRAELIHSLTQDKIPNNLENELFLSNINHSNNMKELLEKARFPTPQNINPLLLIIFEKQPNNFIPIVYIILPYITKTNINTENASKIFDEAASYKDEKLLTALFEKEIAIDQDTKEKYVKTAAKNNDYAFLDFLCKNLQPNIMPAEKMIPIVVQKIFNLQRTNENEQDSIKKTILVIATYCPAVKMLQNGLNSILK